MNAEKLHSLIQALKVRTVANGCTEAEAVMAAEKLADLLDRYHEVLIETPEQAAPCQQLRFATGRKQRQPIDVYLPAVAALFECQLWMERDSDRKISYVVFGLPESLEMVSALEGVLSQALNSGWNHFSKSQRFIRKNDDPKAAFQFGMAGSLADQILSIVAARAADAHQRKNAAGGGRILTVFRRSLVQQAFEALDLTFREGGQSGRRFDGDLYTHGQTAATAVDLGLDNRPALSPEGCSKKARKSKTPGF